MTLSQLSRSQLSRWRGIPAADLRAIGLVAVLVIAAAFRFYDLDRTSLWFDEAYSWGQATYPFSDLITITFRDVPDCTPPLYLTILNFTIALFGDSETALRAPSALFGVATVYLVYRLGSVFWDRTTGLIAALFLALSGFHIWYSSEARTYTLLAFTSTLFVLAVIHATRRPSWIALAGCAAAGTALLYTHTYGAFLFVGINLAVLGAIISRADWVRVGFLPWVITQAVPSLIFVPWAVAVIEHASLISAAMSWIGRPTFEGAGQQLTMIAGGQRPLLILSVLVLLSLFNPVQAARNKRWIEFGYPQLLVFTWLTTPFIVGLFISLFVQPILFFRYLMCSLPALMLLAARGLNNIAFSPIAKIGLVTIVSAFLLPAAYDAAALAERDDNRAAAAYFLENARPGDLVVFQQPYNEISYKYYARNYKFNEVSYNDIINAKTNLTRVNRIWLLTWNSTESDVQSFAAALSGSFDQAVAQHYESGWVHLGLRLFKRR